MGETELPEEQKLALQFSKAATILLSDWPPPEIKTLDALLFHARAAGDEDGLFELAAELTDGTPARVWWVAINGSDDRRFGGIKPGEAWPGHDNYAFRLKSAGVNRVRSSQWALHTREENSAFLELAIEQDWRVVAVLCQPHQAVRTMLGMVQAMAQRNHWLRVYVITPRSTSWEKEVFGRQGRVLEPRRDHIDDEFGAVLRYLDSGELGTFEELFEYLLRRERIPWAA